MADSPGRGAGYIRSVRLRQPAGLTRKSYIRCRLRDSRSGSSQRSAMHRVPPWPASASRDANLLAPVVRRNLKHPFAYAPERTAPPPAIARPAAAGLDFVLQQAPCAKRTRDIPLAGLRWRKRATAERAADTWRSGCATAVAASVGTRIRACDRSMIVPGRWLTGQRVAATTGAATDGHPLRADRCKDAAHGGSMATATAVQAMVVGSHRSIDDGSTKWQPRDAMPPERGGAAHRFVRAPAHHSSRDRCQNASVATRQSEKPLRRRITLSSCSRNCPIDARETHRHAGASVARSASRVGRACLATAPTRERRCLRSRGAMPRGDTLPRTGVCVGKPIFMRVSSQRRALGSAAAMSWMGMRHRRSVDARAGCGHTSRSRVARCASTIEIHARWNFIWCVRVSMRERIDGVVIGVRA